MNMELNEESATLLAKKPTNAKAAIIKKLSHSWPITAKAMTLVLQREFGIEITYQGVHKALTQLEEEKIIERGEKGYQLRSGWIKSIITLSRQIEHNYSNNESLDFEKEITQKSFDNWISMGRFLIFVFKVDCPNPENKPLICNWIHVWPVMTFSSEEIKRIEELHQKVPHYHLSPNNTLFDQTLSEWIQKMDLKYSKTGVDIRLQSDIIVNGDFIAQIFYPDEFQKIINIFYAKTTDMKNLNFTLLQKIATQKTEIRVVIIKNSELADQIRKQSIAFFSKNK